MTNPKSQMFRMMVISFLGSLPPGIINLRVSNDLLNNRIAEATAFSSGAALSEMVVVVTLILVKDRLRPEWVQRKNIRIAGAILLVGMAAFFILPSTHQFPIDLTCATLAIPGLSGFVMNLFNPFQLPFWITWTMVLNPPRTTQPPGRLKALMEGTSAALGTLFALGLYGSTAHWLGNVFHESKQVVGKWCGFALGTMAVLQLYKHVLSDQKVNKIRKLTKLFPL